MKCVKEWYRNVLYPKKQNVLKMVKVRWDTFYKSKIFYYEISEAIVLLDDITNMLSKSLTLMKLYKNNNSDILFKEQWESGYYTELLLNYSHYIGLETFCEIRHINKFKFWRFLGKQMKLSNEKMGNKKSYDRKQVLEFCRKKPLSITKRFILWVVAI